MPYVGNQIRQYSDRVVLDSLTASATADYTLQLNSVNFVPSSAESLTVSLNGIIQAPISSYTVSGSTLSFSSALTASDTIDFIIAERGITLQTPSAGSVNTTQLADNAVTYAKSTGFGKLGQVQSVFTANTQTTTSTTFVDVTGMSQTITPSSTSSKVLVTCSFFAGSIPSSKPYFKLLRGSTILGQITVDSIDCTFAIANPSSPDTDRAGDTVTLTFLDSPASTSEQTYKLQFRTGNSSYTAYFGRRDINDNTNAGAGITLMEVLG